MARKAKIEVKVGDSVHYVKNEFTYKAFGTTEYGKVIECMGSMVAVQDYSGQSRMVSLSQIKKIESCNV